MYLKNMYIKYVFGFKFDFKYDKNIFAKIYNYPPNYFQDKYELLYAMQFHLM